MPRLCRTPHDRGKLDQVHEVYPDNDRVSYVYNSRNRLEQILGGASGQIIVDADYRASGQLEACEVGDGVVSNHSYDSRLRMIGLETTPVAAPTDPLVAYGYEFDPASNITRIDDLRPGSLPLGDDRRNTQVFAYDDLYRLLGVQYSFNLPGGGTRDDGTVSYSYDKLGNMTSKTSTLSHVEGGVPITNLGAFETGGSPAGAFNRDGRNPGAPPAPTP